MKMKDIDSRDIAGGVGCLVIILLIIFLSISVVKISNEIQDKGLKNIITEIWEGKR